MKLKIPAKFSTCSDFAVNFEQKPMKIPAKLSTRSDFAGIFYARLAVWESGQFPGGKYYIFPKKLSEKI